MSVKHPRAATQKAIERVEYRMLIATLAATISTGSGAIRMFDKAHAASHSVDLLRARLRRRKPFRILWWNVIAVLGASALFVGFIIHMLNVWSS